MTVTRLFADSTGESHLEDVGDAGAPSPFDESRPASAIRFMVLAASDGPGAWHPAPRRQLVVWMKGSSDVETSDGSRRRVGPGDALICEDVAGRGHRNHHHDEIHAVFVQLDDA